MDLTLSQQEKLIQAFAPYLTPDRKATIEAVLAQRTRYLTVVAEGFHITQNVSALLRTCEGFGIQDVHIINPSTDPLPETSPTETSPPHLTSTSEPRPIKLHADVTRGCNKWLTLHPYNWPEQNNTQLCVQVLRSQGYRLVATCPNEDALAPEALPLDQKTALLMGNEQRGLSSEALQAADLTVKIPMVGFSESFNVSVSAAVCLYTLTRRLRQTHHPWSLEKAEKIQLRYQWYKQSARSSDALEKHFLAQLDAPLPG